MNDNLHHSLNAISNTVVEIRNNCLSVNGFPIYDLMCNIPGHRGFIGASELCFYTEDETLLNTFRTTLSHNKVKDALEFMMKHPDTIQRTREIPTMDSSKQLAFCHLIDSKTRQMTLKNSYFGVAHLVLEDKVLVFKQNDMALRNMFSDKDFTNPLKLFKVQQELYDLWEDGKIKPDTAFEGVACERLKTSLAGTSYQHDIFSFIEIAQAFTSEFNIPAIIKPIDKKSFGLEFHQHNIVLTATEDSKQAWMTVDDKPCGQPKNQAQFIDELYQLTYGNKLDNFKRKAIKL